MKIVAMGDSITQGYPFTNQASWVEYLSLGLKCQIFNQGICGDFTSGMRERFQRDVLDHTPTHVIILGGANDAYEQVPLESVSANFMGMEEACSEHGIIPIFGLPTPSLLPVEEQFLGLYRHWFKNYAEEKGIKVIDFYTPFMARIGTGQGAQLFTDEVHPSIKGYALMGDVAIEAFQDIAYSSNVF